MVKATFGAYGWEKGFGGAGQWHDAVEETVEGDEGHRRLGLGGSSLDPAGRCGKGLRRGAG